MPADDLRRHGISSGPRGADLGHRHLQFDLPDRPMSAGRCGMLRRTHRLGMCIHMTAMALLALVTGLSFRTQLIAGFGAGDSTLAIAASRGSLLIERDIGSEGCEDKSGVWLTTASAADFDPSGRLSILRSGEVVVGSQNRRVYITKWSIGGAAYQVGGRPAPP